MSAISKLRLLIVASAAVIGATTSFAADKAAESLTVVREGTQVALTWVQASEVTYQEVHRDTDANPAGRVRVGKLRGDVRSTTDALPDAKGEYFYWIKYVTKDGKTSNIGPVKAVKGKLPAAPAAGQSAQH